MNFGPPLVITSGIVDDAVTAAKIAAGAVGTSEILDAEIVNDDVSASAAIAYSKLNLALGIVNADVSASAAIADTKLAAISTAGKVSGAALTSLANTPSGAGLLPAANTTGKAGPFFAQFTSATGAVANNIAYIRGVNAPATGNTRVYTTFFVPTGATISSIQLVHVPATGGAGNIMIREHFEGLPSGSARVAGTETDTAYVGGASNGVVYINSLQVTSYDELSVGTMWTASVDRLGDDAGDTFAGSVELIGILVNLA